MAVVMAAGVTEEVRVVGLVGAVREEVRVVGWEAVATAGVRAVAARVVAKEVAMATVGCKAVEPAELEGQAAAMEAVVMGEGMVVAETAVAKAVVMAVAKEVE
jgi:hypothetical protein